MGVSVMTDLARRAYLFADGYRRRGVRVVMGGIHPTVLPHEALEHADSVVVGEAEDTWPALVRDAASGRMRPVYRSGRTAHLGGRPLPRRDLYPRAGAGGYTPLATGVETSRGCPYDCEFCSTGPVQGRRYRVRPIPEVIADLARLARLLTPRRRRALEVHYARHAVLTVMAGRFAAGLRLPFFALAGASGVPWRTFLLADALAALISVPVVLGLGWFFASALEEARARLRLAGTGIALLVIRGLVVAAVRRRGRGGPASGRPSSGASEPHLTARAAGSDPGRA